MTMCPILQGTGWRTTNAPAIAAASSVAIAALGLTRLLDQKPA
jgi:hypothetical protein